MYPETLRYTLFLEQHFDKFMSFSLAGGLALLRLNCNADVLVVLYRHNPVDEISSASKPTMRLYERLPLATLGFQLYMYTLPFKFQCALVAWLLCLGREGDDDEMMLNVLRCRHIRDKL